MGKNSQDKGDLSKVMIIGALMKKDKKVLDTIGENHRFDLAFYEEGTRCFKTVQCKTGQYKNGCVIFPTCSVVKNSKTGKHERRTYKGQVDFFWSVLSKERKVLSCPGENCRSILHVLKS